MEKTNLAIELCIFELVYNLGHKILELYNVLVQIRLTTEKMKHDIYYSKLVILVAL